MGPFFAIQKGRSHNPVSSVQLQCMPVQRVRESYWQGPPCVLCILYSDGFISIRPNDQRRVGMYMPAPWRSVTTEIIAAAPKPKVTRGKLECVYAFSFLATYRFAKKRREPIRAPTANSTIPT